MNKLLFYRFCSVLFLSGLLAACESLSNYLWYISLQPSNAFEAPLRSSAPVYSDIKNWAAHPELQDNSDILPDIPFSVHKSPVVVDVFFIHPTTYYSSNNWNQPLDDKEANNLTDDWVLLNQASIFSSCCFVYAPRYRQATLYSVLSNDPDGDRALDVAYQDVKASFEYYLNNYNQGRPFIIASHSQGAWHALRLLEESQFQQELRQQLIVGYLVGMPLPMDKFSRSLEELPLCEEEKQSQCIVTWNSVSESADVSFYYQYARVKYKQFYESNQGKKLSCINPLTWSTNNKPAASSLNLGGVNFNRNRSYRPKPDEGLVAAQCIDGILYITEPKTSGYNWLMFGKGNYHMHDYDLFHMNVRTNVGVRINSYLSQKEVR